MKYLFCLLLFIGQLEAQDQVVPLPPSVSNVDDIVNEFRETLISKVSEVGKNFISTINGKTIIFTNGQPLRCNGELTQIGQPVSSLQYNFKKSDNELSEKSVYTGCNNQVSLVEDVVTKGSDLKSLEYDDFIKGTRSFDLKPNEDYRLYRLSNSENEEIFKLVIERSKIGKTIEMYIVESKFLTMTYEFQIDSTRLTFKYHGYKGKYVRNYARWGFDVSYDPFTNTVMAKKTKLVETSFFDTRGVRFSQKDFLSRVEDYLFNGPIKRIRDILDYHNYYFPSTEVVNSGGQNERLKEELRILNNRLLNNTEINLVRKQIQDYIEAAESGLLLDKRPKL